MKLEPHDTIVFQGDSVTDCGRTKPSSDWWASPLGTGYVNIFNGLVNSIYPDYFINVVNKGVDGDNSTMMRTRWMDDVIGLNPEWVSVMIGINDVWRLFDSPQLKDGLVTPDKARENLESVVDRTIEFGANLKGILLVSPVYWENNKDDAMYKAIKDYQGIVQDVARDKGVYYVDVQSVADEMMKHCYSSYIAWDRVHPNIIGHTAIARTILNALEFDFNRKYDF